MDSGVIEIIDYVYPILMENHEIYHWSDYEIEFEFYNCSITYSTLDDDGFLCIITTNFKYDKKVGIDRGIQQVEFVFSIKRWNDVLSLIGCLEQNDKSIENYLKIKYGYSADIVLDCLQRFTKAKEKIIKGKEDIIEQTKCLFENNDS